MTNPKEKSKPREFDLYFVIDEDGSISPYDSSICENNIKWENGCGWAEPDVHVIEYSAYQQALEQINKLEKALEYYGDGKNWLHVSHNPFIKNNCGSDGGAIANQALAELKKWRGEND